MCCRLSDRLRNASNPCAIQDEFSQVDRPRASRSPRPAARRPPAVGLAAALALLLTASPPGAAADSPGDPNAFRIEALSTRPYLVSGGDVLLRVGVPKQVALEDARVTLNGADVTAAFRADPSTHSLTGLLTGLVIGENSVVASAARGAGRGGL